MDSKQQNTVAPKPDKTYIWQLLFKWVGIQWAGFKAAIERATQRTPKQGQQKVMTPEQQFYLEEGIEPENKSGFADKVEGGFIAVSSGISLIFFTLILGYGNGFFFSGFHDFQLGGWIGMMYLGGFLLDATATSSLIVAKRNYKTHKTRFVWGLIGFVGLAIVSAVTQYYMYKAQIARGVIDLPSNALSSVPVFSFLLGNSTVEWFIWARSIVFHGAIVIATFLIPVHSVDVRATVAKMLELTKAKGEIARARQAQEQEKMLTEGFIEMWKTYNAGFQVKMQEWAHGQIPTVVTGSLAQQPQIEYRDKIVEIEKPVIVEKYRDVPQGYVLDSDNNLIPATAFIPKPEPMPEPQPLIMPTIAQKPPVEQKPIELHPVAVHPQISTTEANGHSVVSTDDVMQQPTITTVNTTEEDDGNPLLEAQ